MTTIPIRQKLYNYLEVADDKKIKAMYVLFEEDIEQDELEYTDEFKAELDKRAAYYKNGGKMVSAEDAKKRIQNILTKC